MSKEAPSLPASKNSSPISTVSEVPSFNTLTETKTGPFFPWLETDSDERAHLSLRKLKRFPRTGAVALLGSALTTVISWGILKGFDQRVIEELPKHLPKPAAFLSILLSLNALLVNMAVGQGQAVSWWYRASKKQTTVADLHNVWATGTSLLEAALSWKTLNYIGLATIFTATLPINGILLQNAIESIQFPLYSYGDVVGFNIVSQPPADWYSADLNDDGSFSIYNAKWSDMIPQVIANSQGGVNTYSNLTTCREECQANLTSIGFEATCVQSRIPYTLPFNDDSTGNMSESIIFSVDFTWNASTPYIVGLNTLFKADPNWAGFYDVQNCTLQLGKVLLPAVVQYNVSEDATGTITNNTWFLDYYDWMDFENDNRTLASPYQNVPADLFTAYTPPKTAETTYTAFGGIVAALQEYYGSRIIFSPTADGIETTATGQYGRQVQIYNGGYDDDGNPYEYSDVCNTTFTYFGGDGNSPTPVTDILAGVRDTLFYTSVLIPDVVYDDGDALINDFDNSTVQTIATLLEYKEVFIYQVVWKFWGASLVVTLCILLLILPLYWGFWTLARKTTMSPFETARVFNAPILFDMPKHMDTPTLLKEVGHVKHPFESKDQQPV